ncbi:GGDEF domain-containing phosphodiesterase [Crocosphaera sp.]|uniref:sensor domain-containing protein n=1 Tax=Crocosphaera sp. TaxID=2729996 RepID=UPI0026134C3B|nr:GGDEF domain-containing phosphodiesterase [Crocosphaera sp.]MDJ0579737.1 EAL domain-containing protein [Crocosphaera sp.]
MNKTTEYKNNLTLALKQLNQQFSDLSMVACAWIQTIINIINDSVIVLDTNYTILMVNQTTINLLGYSEKELVNKSILNILYQNSDDVSIIENSSKKTIESAYFRKNNQEVEVLLSSQLIYSEDQEIMAIICIAQDISQEKRIEKLIKENERKLYYDLRHDKLTGLPNRKLFIEELETSLEKAQEDKSFCFTVLILDLDQFKLINNSYGHLMGDNLLIQMGERLKTYLHEQDILARLGGDEFGIILNHLGNLDHTLEIVDLIKKGFALPFQLNGHEVYSSASIGITISDTKYQKFGDILRDTGAALNQAKIKDKASYTIFRQEMYVEAVNRLELDNDLRRAIERQEFELTYQPIVELNTQKVIGFEALIRWQHPKKGLINPGKFIPIAEETGLIIPLSNWILNQGCQQMCEWQKLSDSYQELIISINLSVKQFSENNLVEEIINTLQNSGMNKNCLKLEITESCIIKNTEEVCSILNQLKALGINLSMDDFGTGYSSLSYLHRFPFDTLKIDRSFIKDMSQSIDKLRLTQTIIHLANDFGMEVIAEGIETKKQWEQLKQLGCSYGQGYYFAQPLTAEEVEKIILKGNNPLII